MSINLTDEEAMVLSKLAYARFTDSDTLEDTYKNKTLQTHLMGN